MSSLQKKGCNPLRSHPGQVQWESDLETLLKARPAAREAPQKVQPSAANFAVAFDHHFINTRRARQEGALNADAVAGDAAHGERGGRTAAVHVKHSAFKFLDALAVAFANLHMNADSIAWFQVWNIRVNRWFYSF